MKPYQYSIVIGRFQPLHAGHMDLIRHAHRLGEKTLVLIGSSNKSRTMRNPYTFQERWRMLHDTFRTLPTLLIGHLPDDSDDVKWAKNVRYQTECLGHVQDGVLLMAQDHKYGKWFQHDRLIVKPVRQISGTEIRQHLKEKATKPLSIPNEVWDLIQGISYESLADE